MAFELPDLPYAHDALADKGMSKETLEYHHDKHHNAYCTKLNELIEGGEYADLDLEEIVKKSYDASGVPQNGVFNNASQLWNHNQFWEMMGPDDSEISGKLKEAIESSFGSVDDFKKEFKEKGLGQFGSGWVWLVQKSDGKLAVENYANGINPVAAGDTGLLGCDVWEHAYYIDTRNDRGGYIQNFLDKLVNWDNVASRLA
ncbi:superoxide dismutase [Paracoccaceae bacterium GXU_MW_L88]